MRLACPRCHRAVPEAGINLAAGRAACVHCAEHFAVSDVREPQLAVVNGTHLPLDLKWSESVEWSGVRFAVAPSPTSRVRALPLIALALLWDGPALFVAEGVSAALRPRSSFFCVLAAIVLAPAFLLTWVALARLLNRTVITLVSSGRSLVSSGRSLEGGRLRVRHGPIPAPGVEIPLDEIEGFEVGARPLSRSNSPAEEANEPSVVQAVTKGGERRELPLWQVSDIVYLWFVAARLNAALIAVQQPMGYRVAHAPPKRALVATERADGADEADDSRRPLRTSESGRR